MKDFKTLNVWQKSHNLAIAVYKLTYSFPKEEIYGITSQLRRAIISIPTNLAEGCGRGSDKDFARFIQIAFGSASESEYLVILSKDLGLINQDTWENLMNDISEVKRMLAALLKSINK
jgi:four helix bundle protein